MSEVEVGGGSELGSNDREGGDSRREVVMAAGAPAEPTGSLPVWDKVEQLDRRALWDPR